MPINGIEMVTDRSIADVNYAKSLIKKGVQAMIDDGTIEQYLAGLKGAYNYTDINRVESVVRYLDNALVGADFDIRNTANFLGVALDSFFEVPYNPKDYGSLTTKIDWTRYDMLYSIDRDRYVSNIRYIVKSMIDDLSDIPESLDKLDYNGANIIESYLEDTNKKLELFLEEKTKLLQNTASAWMYSGEIYGGEI